MRECPRCERCYDDEVLLCPDDQAKTKLTLPGTTLLNARYRLEKRLGRGAMGQVYVARDENLITRRVAVKIGRASCRERVMNKEVGLNLKRKIEREEMQHTS